MFWVWLAGAVLLVILEMLTGVLVLFCLSFGCAVAALLALFLPRLYWAQAMVFSGLGLLSTVCLLPTLAEYLEWVGRRRHAVRLLGREGVVEEAIEMDKPGTVRVDGVVWPAMATQPLPPSTPVVVRRVEGHILHVETG